MRTVLSTAIVMVCALTSDSPAIEYVDSIMAVDVNTHNAVSVVTGVVLGRGVAIDPANHKLYWTQQGWAIGSSYQTIRSPAPGAVFRANLDGTNQQTLVAVDYGGYPMYEPHGIAVAPGDNKMFWSVLDDPHRIDGASLDGSDKTNVLNTTEYKQIRAIAVDPVNDEIYWGENAYNSLSTNVIRRSDLTGGNIENLIESSLVDYGYIGITGIAVAPESGKMFWSSGNGIRKANLDGSGEQLLVAGYQRLWGITLDLVNQKMYWMDTFTDSIMQSGLDGSNIQTVYTCDGQLRESTIAVDPNAGKLYFFVAGAAIPEPSTITLFCVGTIALLAWYWHQR